MVSDYHTGQLGLRKVLNFYKFIYMIWSSITSAHLLLFSSSLTKSSHTGLLKVPQIHLACPASAWLPPLPPSGLCSNDTFSKRPTLTIPETPSVPYPALIFLYHSLLLTYYDLLCLLVVFIDYPISPPCKYNEGGFFSSLLFTDVSLLPRILPEV